MNMYPDQQRRVPAVTIVVVLFIVCVLASHYWAAKQFPALAGLVQIHPSLVFLEIPVQLPVSIDLVLTLILFLISYSLVTLVFPRYAGLPIGWQTAQRVRAAIAGIVTWLVCTLTAGVVYYFVQDHLSARVVQGLNTLGLNAEIHLGVQSFSLRGSMVVLTGFFIGLILFIRKVRKAPRVPLTRDQRITPYERMLTEKRMGIKQEYTKPVHIPRPSGNACYTPPVISLRPLAVNYMPMH